MSTDRNFTKVPNAIFTLYTRLPDFKADHALLYVYLCARLNRNYGYAFPSTDDIAHALNCGINQVVTYKRVLRKYRLITTKRHPTLGNDMYFIHPPIDNEAEFYGKYEEAREYYERRSAQFASRGARPKRAEPDEVPDHIAKFTAWL
ncbi:helix-turn-helix domain-containing protein [Paenibacillus luteus]|uniref:helix-turn-helix domain-containing protein n=1 Tax=Paenibacillus luteus TaxID=2545753 RepID=UPI00114120C4|nr:helix-turn-helix domain-containing protein [Paenibacillus luteus]